MLCSQGRCHLVYFTDTYDLSVIEDAKPYCPLFMIIFRSVSIKILTDFICGGGGGGGGEKDFLNG